MQQGGDQLHLHALAQGQLAHRLTSQLLDAEHLGELAEGALERFRRERVDLAVQLKTVSRRQVPPELILLPHDERETTAKGVGPFPGAEAKDAGPAPPGGSGTGTKLTAGRFR